MYQVSGVSCGLLFESQGLHEGPRQFGAGYEDFINEERHMKDALMRIWEYECSEVAKRILDTYTPITKACRGEGHCPRVSSGFDTLAPT